MRRERDPQAAASVLATLREATKNGANTMPAFMACTHEFSTLVPVSLPIYSFLYEELTRFHLRPLGEGYAEFARIVIS